VGCAFRDGSMAGVSRLRIPCMGRSQLGLDLGGVDRRFRRLVNRDPAKSGVCSLDRACCFCSGRACLDADVLWPMGFLWRAHRLLAALLLLGAIRRLRGVSAPTLRSESHFRVFPRGGMIRRIGRGRLVRPGAARDGFARRRLGRRSDAIRERAESRRDAGLDLDARRRYPRYVRASGSRLSARRPIR